MQRILLVAFLMLAGGAASAQQTFSEVQRAAMAQQSAATPVRVNVSINIFVLAPAGMGDQAMAEQEKARRQIYQLATKECAVIRHHCVGLQDRDGECERPSSSRPATG